MKATVEEFPDMKANPHKSPSNVAGKVTDLRDTQHVNSGGILQHLSSGHSGHRTGL